MKNPLSFSLSAFTLRLLLLCLVPVAPALLAGCSSDNEAASEESGGEDAGMDPAEADLDATEAVPAKTPKSAPEPLVPELDLDATGLSDAPPASPPPAASAAPADSQAPAGQGTLGFVNPEKGISVTAIKWDQPIGQDNPGADCELRAAKKAGVYTCVVREGALVAILNITELNAGGRRRIAKITMDGKGAPTWRRWLQELRANGFTTPKGKMKTGPRTTYVSADGVTRADVIWVPKAKAVTIILRPARGF